MKVEKSRTKNLVISAVLVYLLLVPEFLLFVFVGSENIIKSKFGILVFFVSAILLYSLVPLKIEKRNPIEKDIKGNLRSQVLVVFIALLTIVVKNLIVDQVLPKFILEFYNFYKSSGLVGLIGGLLQHLYYLAEMILCSYLLRAFQEIGEDLFENKWLPYGGLALAILWGLLIHTISKGLFTGIYMMLISIIWGFIYILSGKNRLLTYLLMVLIFIS